MGGRKTRAVTLMLLSSLSFSIMQVFVKDELHRGRHL